MKSLLLLASLMSMAPTAAFAHHPHYSQSPVPVGQHQAQPLVVKKQSSAPQQQRCGGVIARMGLGGILGGVAGRYAVRGKKSRHTVLGTTIGVATGSLIGSATC